MVLAIVMVSVAVFAQNATVEKVWIENNVYQSGQEGMNVHTHFTVEDLKGKKGAICLYFCDSQKQKLQSQMNPYKHSSSGQLYTIDFFTPLYEDTEFNDYPIFVPYQAFSTDNGFTYVVIYSYISNTYKKLDISTWIPFAFNRSSQYAGNDNNNRSIEEKKERRRNFWNKFAEVTGAVAEAMGEMVESYSSTTSATTNYQTTDVYTSTYTTSNDYSTYSGSSSSGSSNNNNGSSSTATNKKPKPCDRCNGTGYVVDDMTPFSTSLCYSYPDQCRKNVQCQICGAFHCTHLRKHVECSKCHGTGFEKQR